MTLRPSQNRLLSFALTLGVLLSIGAMLTLSVWVIGRVLLYFSFLLWPLAAAVILAVIFMPVVGFFERRLKFSRTKAIFLLYGLLLIVAVVMGSLLIPTVLSEAVGLAVSLPDLAVRALTFLQSKIETWAPKGAYFLHGFSLTDLARKLQLDLTQASHLALAAFGQLAGHTFDVLYVLFGVLLVPIYLFYFLGFDLAPVAQETRLNRAFAFLPKNYRDPTIFLFQEFIGIMTSFFRGQILVGLTTGSLLALGFIIVGLKFGLLIGLAMGVANIVPFLGTILGLAVAIPTALFQEDGGVGTLALVLAVYAAAQLIEVTFTTPRIMGKKTGLHPMAIIFSILFWGKALGGVLGMVIGIPLTAFLVTAWRLFERTYATPKE
ncbi:MAG: AI-2E family transporter [Pseudomonadota bacterium]